MNTFYSPQVTTDKTSGQDTDVMNDHLFKQTFSDTVNKCSLQWYTKYLTMHVFVVSCTSKTITVFCVVLSVFLSQEKKGEFRK